MEYPRVNADIDRHTPPWFGSLAQLQITFGANEIIGPRQLAEVLAGALSVLHTSRSRVLFEILPGTLFPFSSPALRWIPLAIILASVICCSKSRATQKRPILDLLKKARAATFVLRPLHNDAMYSTSQPTAKRLADVISSYRPAKSLKNSSQGSVITSLDFDDTGEWLLAACDDESIQLYDCKLGKHSKELFSKKYGVHLARFTHNHTNCIYASTKQDDTIRYLSLHDNSYIRYFRGHKQPVNCLEVSPLNDLFLSSSLDNTIRFWDLRSANCAGVLNIDTPAQIAHDPTGVSFAVASHQHSHLFLYDVRMFDKEPFAMFPILDDEYLKQFSYPPMMPDWSKVEFSNDGRFLMVGTNARFHYIIDSFKGEIKCRLQRKAPTPVGRDGKWDMLKASGDICFTPDAAFVIGGQAEKSVAMWDLNMKRLDKDKNLAPFIELDSPKGAASVVAFNPRNHIFATAHREVSFWLPDQHVAVPSPGRE